MLRPALAILAAAIMCTTASAQDAGKNYKFGTATTRGCAPDIWIGHWGFQQGTELLVKSPTEVLFNFPTTLFNAPETYAAGAAVVRPDVPGATTGSVTFLAPLAGINGPLDLGPLPITELKMERLVRSYEMSFKLQLPSSENRPSCIASIHVLAFR